MVGKLDPHLDEETTERYSMGKLSARKVQIAEEHLLICARCRRAVSASDAQIKAMRQAAAKLRKAERKPKKKPTRKAEVNN